MPGSGPLGNRCVVTLLFTDMRDYTALNEASDPEDVAQLMGAIKAAYEEVIASHGGIVNQIYGDGVLGLFGYPTPKEDDARRAVYAAIDLRDRVASLRLPPGLPLDFIPRLHTGVHAGLVYVGPGNSIKGRYEVTGDAINTAARLCAAAGDDEIFVSEASLSGDLNFFEVQALEPLTLRGKQEALRVVRILGRSDVQSRFESRARRGLTPFVGRVREVAQLEGALAALLAGKQQYWCVTGAPGIGKSRLLERLASRAAGAGARVLFGGCETEKSVTPFGPFRGVLQQVFGIAAETSASDAAQQVTERLGELAPDLPSAPFLQALGFAPVRTSVDGEAVQAAVRSAIGELCERLARQQPVLLTLDDWQWVDEASQRLLGGLLARTRELPLMVVLGSREALSSSPGALKAQHLHLAPFQPSESLAVIRSLSLQFGEIGFATSLHQRCGGNPLFLEELCRALDERGHGLALDGAAIPTTVHGLIRARLSALPQVQIEFLQVASVFGAEFDLASLSEVYPTEQARTILKELVDHDWIFESATGADYYRFKHGISREVAYESVLLTERRRLHQLLFDLLIRRTDASTMEAHTELLAYHAVGSGNHDHASLYAERAGDRATAISALDSARRHYRASLDALDRLPSTLVHRARWVAISCKWAEACVYNPALEQLDTLEKAKSYARELSDSNGLALVEYWCGWIHYALGDYAKAIAVSQSALELARATQRPRLIMQLHFNLGQCHAAAGDYPAAIAHLNDGLERQRSMGRPQGARTTGPAYALGYLALVAGDIGDFDRAYACLREAQELLAGSNNAVGGAVLAQRGMIELWQGDYQSAAATADRMRAIAERVNGRYIFAMSRVIGGCAGFELSGRLEALMEVREGCSWLETHHVGLNLSWAYGWAAEAFSRAKNGLLAREYARKTLGRVPLRDVLGEAMAYRALARVAVFEGLGVGVARSYLAHAQRAARSRGSRRERLLVRKAVHELALDVGRGAGARRAQLTRAMKALGLLDRFQANLDP